MASFSVLRPWHLQVRGHSWQVCTKNQILWHPSRQLQPADVYGRLDMTSFQLGITAYEKIDVTPSSQGSQTADMFWKWDLTPSHRSQSICMENLVPTLFSLLSQATGLHVKSDLTPSRQWSQPKCVWKIRCHFPVWGYRQQVCMKH